MKKIITLIFCLCFAMLIQAQTAIAPTTGNGTAGNPYQIATWQNLYWISQNEARWSQYYIQTADIDFSTATPAITTWDSNKGWTTIGGANDFTGSYNGQNHIISGIYINRPTTEWVGFFGSISNCTIQNIGLTNVSITGNISVGGLSGYVWNGCTVSNCYTTGSVTGKTQNTGGLIGSNDGDYGINTVSLCHSSCTVSSATYAGGLIGNSTTGTVSSCYATGNISISGYINCGGLIGNNTSRITNCYATGTVTCTCNSSESYNIGGLIGYSNSPDGVSSCYATGSVSCTTSSYPSIGLGGLIGFTETVGTVSNCYATGSVTSSVYVYGSNINNLKIGGLIGVNGCTVNGCLATGATFGGSYVGGLIGDNQGAVSDCYSSGSVSSNGLGGYYGGLIGHNTSSVSKSYTISSVNTTGTIAGFVGDNSGVINNNCFWDNSINTNGLQSNSGTFSALGKTTAQMKTQSTYTGAGWNFTVWGYNASKNNMYPYISWQTLFSPTLTTTVSAASTTSATMGGNITDIGNANVTERGIVYSSSNTTPIIGGTGVTKMTNGSGSGSFSSSVGSLIFGTKYYVQSYATNSMGTSYGGVQAFAINTISSIVRVGSTPTNAASVSWTVTFAASITGLTASNFSLVNTSLTSPSITNVTGSGTTWTVTANTGSGSGSMGLNLVNNTGLSTAFTNTLPFAGEVYTIDKTVPTVTSINRQSPTDATTMSTSVVYRVTFSKSVINVDISDFIQTKTETTTGTIASVSASTGTAIDVTVNSISGVGTLRLDLNSSGTGITDNAGNAISGGYTSGQTYTIFTPGTYTGTDSNWGTASNWASNSVPTSTTDVTIPSGKTAVIGATATAACNNLTVSGTLTIQSSVSGTGSLIVSGTSTGSVNCQRYMTNGKWHLISPIAEGGSISTFIQAPGNAIPNNSGNYGMMDYDETTNSWKPYFTTETVGNLTAGKGYSVRRTTDGIVTFTGTLTTATKTVALFTSGQGWNCVGNPYASAIGINSSAASTENFITENSSNLDPSYACVYVWDEDASYAGQNCYKIISNTDFSLPSGKTRLSMDYVAPGQGFFVKAKTGTSNISFTALMQSQLVSTPFKAPAITTSWTGIELNAATTDASSSAIIAFNGNMTNGLDPTFDAGLLRGTNGLSLYTRLLEDNGVDFAIQCLPENYNNLVIPVGVDSKSGGDVTFSAENVGLPTGCNVVLEDKTTGTFSSLIGGATYIATLPAETSGTGRFYIHTEINLATGTWGQTVEINNLKAYAVNGKIIIEGEVSDKAIATLYDLQGLKVLVHSLQKGSMNILSCPYLMTGIYMLTIQQDGKIVTRKLIMK